MFQIYPLGAVFIQDALTVKKYAVKLIPVLRKVKVTRIIWQRVILVQNYPFQVLKHKLSFINVENI